MHRVQTVARVQYVRAVKPASHQFRICTDIKVKLLFSIKTLMLAHSFIMQTLESKGGTKN